MLASQSRALKMRIIT